MDLSKIKVEQAEPSEIYTTATKEYNEPWIEDYTAHAYQMANGKPFCLQLCVTKGVLEHSISVRKPSIYVIQVSVFANDSELLSFVTGREYLMREIIYSKK